MEDEKIIFEYRGYKSEAYVNHKAHNRIHGNIYSPGKWDKPLNGWSYAANDVEDARKSFEKCVEELIEAEAESVRQQEWEQVTDHISVGQVFAIKPRAFEQRVKEGKFDKNLLIAVKGGVYAVPIYYITKAWDVLLKGSLPNAYMIGCEEEEDATEEDIKEFMEECQATRTRAEAYRDNELMKDVWKRHFGIDIDVLDVDFRVFDMHLSPNVSYDEYRDYFCDVPNGIHEWILDPINYCENDYPDGVRYHVAASLMEYTADVLQYRDECSESPFDIMKKISIWQLKITQ